MIDLCKYTQHECELICPQSRDCMRQPPDELCARSSRCYSWFPRADSPGSVSGILCCAGITIQRCVDIAQGAKAASCTFPPVFMPRTAELRAGGGLGPPVPAKRPPAVSVIFFTAAPATWPPATNSMGCRQQAKFSCTRFPKEYSKAALMAMRCADAMVDCLDTSTHLRDCPVAAEKPGLPAGDHIDAFVHAIKVHLHRNRGWSLC